MPARTETTADTAVGVLFDAYYTHARAAELGGYLPEHRTEARAQRNLATLCLKALYVLSAEPAPVVTEHIAYLDRKIARNLRRLSRTTARD